MILPGLYLVTDRGMLGGKDFLWTVEQAVGGGVGLVQLREKDCPTRDFVALACALKAMLDKYGVPLIINDRVDVALAAGAAGVHLGQSDMDASTARRLLGPAAIIGLSVESREQVIEAEGLEVDYIGISPVFSTPTKTDTVTQWGLDGIKWVRNHSRHPLVAIGGINPINAGAIFAAGADLIAVVSCIMASDNPYNAAGVLSGMLP